MYDVLDQFGQEIQEIFNATNGGDVGAPTPCTAVVVGGILPGDELMQDERLKGKFLF